MALALFKQTFTLNSRPAASRSGPTLRRLFSTQQENVESFRGTLQDSHSTLGQHEQQQDLLQQQDQKPRRTPVHKAERERGRHSIDPNLFRIFFRTPDKIWSLEEAQVFISHIKTSYGPLTQYQFQRCPETQKYFGYGFFTFKHKDSLDKALKDRYIRVGRRDFEFQRSGTMPAKRSIIHKNTGFSGFNDLEALRAAKRQLEAKADDNRAEGDSGVRESGQHMTDDTFVSALSFTTEAEADAKDEKEERKEEFGAGEGSPGAKKPTVVPLQKKGMAQLWKVIPDSIVRAEQQQERKESESVNIKDGSM
ncbi:hypothetical protein BGZ94_009280 [Podila epigama]|nr:hypothetical protein BGZ94_009280 [Podila epigama]